MRVLVAGPESTGGRLMARILEPVVDVVHFSLPMGPSRGRRYWPPATDWEGERFDRAVIMVREWHAAASSQARNHGQDDPYATMRNAYRALVDIEVPWWIVTYESLLVHPHATVEHLCKWLGVLAPDLPEIKDGNLKWYG